MKRLFVFRATNILCMCFCHLQADHFQLIVAKLCSPRGQTSPVQLQFPSLYLRKLFFDNIIYFFTKYGAFPVTFYLCFITVQVSIYFCFLKHFACLMRAYIKKLIFVPKLFLVQVMLLLPTLCYHFKMFFLWQTFHVSRKTLCSTVREEIKTELFSKHCFVYLSQESLQHASTVYHSCDSFDYKSPEVLQNFAQRLCICLILDFILCFCYCFGLIFNSYLKVVALHQPALLFFIQPLFGDFCFSFVLLFCLLDFSVSTTMCVPQNVFCIRTLFRISCLAWRTFYLLKNVSHSKVFVLVLLQNIYFCLTVFNSSLHTILSVFFWFSKIALNLKICLFLPLPHLPHTFL